jgi:hypothetical protein
MPDKTFTLDEAQSLLPVLDSLLRRAVKAKQTIEEIDREFQDLTHHIMLAGGVFLDVAALAQRKSQREKSIQSIKDSLAEITAAGVQVKDLDMGLLDFPCVANGETILLCWKLGEPHKIGHWHGLEEGFRGRKPIAQLGVKRKKPEKPN